MWNLLKDLRFQLPKEREGADEVSTGGIGKEEEVGSTGRRGNVIDSTVRERMLWLARL